MSELRGNYARREEAVHLLRARARVCSNFARGADRLLRADFATKRGDAFNSPAAEMAKQRGCFSCVRCNGILDVTYNREVIRSLAMITE